MSTSAPIEASAEINVEFGHGGEAVIGLSSSHESFPQERLVEMLDAARSDIAKDLDIVSHVCEPSENSGVKHSLREFPLVFSGIEFRLEITVTIGELNIPVENVYHITQTWMYAAIAHFCALDVRSLTGAPAVHQEILLAAQMLALSGVMCVVVATGAFADSDGSPDGDPAMN
jgi:hypothetical protein